MHFPCASTGALLDPHRLIIAQPVRVSKAQEKSTGEEAVAERMAREGSFSEMIQVYDLSTFEPKRKKPISEWFLFQNDGSSIADNSSS